MKRFWNSLARREQRFLLAGVAMLCLGAVYLFVWQPLMRDVALNGERVRMLRSDLAWMQAAATKMQQLRSQQAPQATPTHQVPLDTEVERSAYRLHLISARSRIKPDNSGSVSVYLPETQFSSLMRWVAMLDSQGIRVKQLELHKLGADRVSAVLVLQRGAGS